MSDKLTIRYVPLEEIRRWDRNPKRHDLDRIQASYRRYGFKDPPKWEPTLNGGKGGIAEGNGRYEALSKMKARREAPPRGIAVDDAGRWLVPVLYGVDASDVAEAEGYAIDHNALTLLGGDFTTDWVPRLYDGVGLLNVIRDLDPTEDALPITIDADALERLARLDVGASGEDAFDATKLAGAVTSGAAVAEAFIIYVSFKSRESFERSLGLLSFGERDAKAGGQGHGVSQCALNGEAFVKRWADALDPDEE